MLNVLKIWAFTLFLPISIQFSPTLPFSFIYFMNIIFSGDGERLFVESEILTEAAQINGMICAFIEVRVNMFWRFEEDGSRRSWWSLVISVATLEVLANIHFSSRVSNSCLYLMECHVDCVVDAQAKLLVHIYMNLI